MSDEERLELEVSLKREGLRFLCTLLFGLLFACSQVLLVTPQQQYETSVLITEQLGLAGTKVASHSSTEESFQSLMEMSSRARSLYPFSSEYVAAGLDRAFLSDVYSFPRGAEAVSKAAQPLIPSSWSIRFWLQLPPNDRVKPKRRAVMQQRVQHQGRNVVCWAFVCQGKLSYSLVYGEHNILSGAAAIEFDFSGEEHDAEGEPAVMTLVVLNVNSTHATVILETKSKHGLSQRPAMLTRQLPAGTRPSECIGGKMYLGDNGVTLGEATFLPYELSEAAFQDIKQVGQPLQELVAGLQGAQVALQAQGNPEELDAHLLTQEILEESTDTLESLIRLTGAVAYEGALGTHAPDAVLDAGSAPEGDEGPTVVPHADVIADLPQRLAASHGAAGDTLSGNLSAGFSALAATWQGDFTLSWWAQETISVHTAAQQHEDTRVELSLLEGNTTRLQLSYLAGGNLPPDGGWLLRINNAPECPPNDNGTCLGAPAFWCQAPYTGTYDGIWRHFALRFGQQSRDGPAGQELSEVELFVDGVSLCGLSFPGDERLVPHFPLDPDGEVVASLVDLGSGRMADETLQVQDMLLFPSALSAPQILRIAHTSQHAECLMISAMFDNASYRTPFGESCQNLGQHVAAFSPTRSLSACDLPDAKQQCPIACLGTTSHACFDGFIPSKPLDTSPFGRSVRTLLATAEVYASRFSDYYGTPLEQSAAIQRAAADFHWLSGDVKAWTDLFSSVERVPYGAVIMAESLPAKVYSDGVWAAKEPSEDCPGASTGEQLFTSLCDVAELHLSNIASLALHGVPPLELNIAHGFKLGLLQAGTSQTMYFWAKATDVNGVNIAGMDGDNNICFSISQREATLVRRNALHDGNTIEGRITKTIPLMTDDQRIKGKWIFFAFTVDVTLSTVTAMAGESSAVEEMEDLGGWGCNGLQFVANVGGEVLLSPVSVLQAALPFGDLQHVQMRQQAVYAGLVGPRTTRLQRLATQPRERADFVSKMVGISPPLLLQERRTDATPRRCREAGAQDKVVSALEERLEGAKAAMCVKPYDCEDDHRVEVHAGCGGNVTREADSVAQDSEPLFFGRKAYTYKGKKSFPEFPWALGNAVVVRSGRTLRPSAQYLDSNTQEVALVMCIYSVDFQVAGLLEVRLDFTGSKVQQRMAFSQVKLFTDAELLQWLLVTAAAACMAIVCAMLALRAGYEELMDVVRRAQQRAQRWSAWIRGRHMPQPVATPPRRYSADTTQPDLLDVLASVGITVMLVYQMIGKRIHNQELSDVYESLAGLQWGSQTIAFPEKMDTFLEYVTQAIGIMRDEKHRAVLAFVMLMFCALRLIVYMKMHPHLGTIVSTFGAVSVQLINFLVSFGTIFVFMAIVAHIMFGTYVEQYATVQDSLLTQFVVLLTVDVPDVGTDVVMTVYVFSYVLLCVLFMLNFFLAIIVQGYTSAMGTALDCVVARPVMTDVACTAQDIWLWSRNPTWPSKISILNMLQQNYPDVFMNGFDQADAYVGGRLVSLAALQDMFVAGSRRPRPGPVAEGEEHGEGEQVVVMSKRKRRGLVRRVTSFFQSQDDHMKRQAAEAIFQLYGQGFRGKMLVAHL
eukprot:jgi/Tetstr1/434669/TSEL_023760.t1